MGVWECGGVSDGATHDPGTPSTHRRRLRPAGQATQPPRAPAHRTFFTTTRVLARTFLFGALLPVACGLPRWPVRGIVTSPYGLRLVGWSPEVHRGIDIAVPDGTPVVAMSGGTVTFAGQENGYGLLVVLRHHGSTHTLYGHLSELRVKVGDRVQGGQVIALSGHSGNARGPHLHFEVQRWGEAEDPVPLLGGHP